MTKQTYISTCLLYLLIGAAQAQSPANSAPKTIAAPAPAAAKDPAPVNQGAGDDGGPAALVMADNEAMLSAQMAGKILKINYALGEAFASGAILVEFDCAESKAKLDALSAEYLGARETHLAKLRLQGLGAAGDLEVTLAAAAAERAKSQVNQQETQMAYCRIAAPYAGRVARIKAKVAESVASNQPVMEIVATARLKAIVHLPSAQAVQLKQGSRLVIDIRETRQRYHATVARLNARVDGVSQSLEVEAVFSGNTKGLLPGMIGQAIFLDGKRSLKEGLNK